MGSRWTLVPVTLAAAACCILLSALFALDLSLVAAAIRERHNALPAGLLPIATIQPGATYLGDVDPVVAMKIQTIRLAEVAGLVAFGLVLGSSRRQPRAQVPVVLTTACVMALLALGAQATESADMYAYVGLAQAVPSAYHPGSMPLAGDEAVINRLWGLPLVPSAYGPLWIALSKAALAPASTLAAKLMTLRLLGLAAMGICIALLYLLRLSRTVLALFVVNPAVYELFVAQAHNDLIGVAFILAAALARPRSRLVALILCAAAGAIKLPFILIAALVFASEPTAAKRVRFALLSVTVSLSVSLAWGGLPYVRALRSVFELGGGAGSAFQLLLHAAIGLLVVGAIFAAVVRRYFSPALPWLMPALGRTPLPHYLAWSLPAVFLDPKPNWTFLATMPIVAFQLDSAYPVTPLTICLLAAVGFAAVTYAIVLTRRRAGSMPEP